MKKRKKFFTILLPFTFFHSFESIIFKIELITQIIIILYNYYSIYSTQKDDRRNHLLVEYLSRKR